MNYEKETKNLLKQFMSERGLKLWQILERQISPIGDRYSSSSGKYHKKEGGRVPSISEHVFEMLFACSKLFRVFSIDAKTEDSDVLFLAILLHDSFKYGLKPEDSDHTTSEHDRIAANLILESKKIFCKLLNEEQFSLLEESIRFHMGRWSSDAPNKDSFNWKNYDPKSFFIHMLDMFSSRNLIKIPQGD